MNNLSRPFLSALDRLGRGLLGTWCVVGPFVTLASFDDPEPGFFLFLIAFVGAFYLIGSWKWRHQGNSFLRAVAVDTLVMFLFAGVGVPSVELLLLSEAQTSIVRESEFYFSFFADSGFWKAETN